MNNDTMSERARITYELIAEMARRQDAEAVAPAHENEIEMNEQETETVE